MPVFLGSIEVRILELGICMDDELGYGVIVNQAHCPYSSFYLSIFCLLMLNMMHYCIKEHNSNKKIHLFNFFHSKAYGTKSDLAIK